MNKLEVEVETTIKKTPETLEMYEYVVKGLIRHAKRMKSQDPSIHARHKGVLLSIACLDIEPVLQVPLARQKFEAAIYAMKNWPGYFDPRALELLCPEPSESESDRLNRVAIKRAKLKSTGCVKAKEAANHLPIQRWKRVIEAILVSKSKWAAAASDWLCATLVTGLRPREWREATLDANRLSIAAAALNDEKEEIPAHRTIELTCKAAELECVQRFLSTVQHLDNQSFDLMYEGVRALTRTVGQRTFPEWSPAISIDAARQTFLAIKKSSSLDRLEDVPKPQTTPGPEWSRALRAQAALFEDRTKGGN